MTDPEKHINRLKEINSRQDDVLNQLELLNRRVEELLSVSVASEQEQDSEAA